MPDSHRRRTALEQLASTKGEACWRLAYALMGRKEDAEDVVQAAFLVALRKDFPMGRGLWPWFAGVIRGEALNLRRRRSHRDAQALSGEDIKAMSDADKPWYEEKDLQEYLRASLDELPDDEREVLSMTYIAGLSQRQAAKAMDMPLGTLKSIATRGLGRLKSKMQRDKVADALRALPFPLPAAGAVAFAKQSLASALATGSLGIAATSAAKGVGGLAMKKAVAAVVGLIAIFLGIGYSMNWFDGESAPEPKERAVAHAESPVDPRDASHPNKTQSPPTTTPDASVPVPDSEDEPGKETSSVASAATTDAESVELEPERLPEGTPFTVTFSGRVVDQQRRGLECVTIRTHAAHTGTLDALHTSGETTSEEDGSFILECKGIHNAENDRARVFLRATLASFPAAETYPYLVQTGDAFNHIQLRMVRGKGAIFGNVVDELSGEAVAGVEVLAEHSRGYFDLNTSNTKRHLRFDQSEVTGPVTTKANQAGEFRFDNLLPGNYELHAEFENEKRGYKGSSSRIRIESSEVGPIRLVVQRQGTLTFTITNKDVSGVKVQLDEYRRSSTPTYRGYGKSCQPDSDGIYRVSGFTLRTNHAVIKAKGYGAAKFTLPPRESESHDLGAITLEKGREVSGRVLDESGRAIAGAEVWIQSDSYGGYSQAGGPPTPPRLEETTTDDLGNYTLVGVEPGYFQLAAIAEGRARGVVRLRIPDDRDVEDKDITLRAAGTLVGTVSLPPRDGGGIEGQNDAFKQDIVVLISSNNIRVKGSAALDTGMLVYLAGTSSLRTDIQPDGSYRLDSVPAGNYLGIAIYGRRATYSQSIVIRKGEETTRNFTFPPPGGVIHGILTRGGVPLPHKGVRLRFLPTPGEAQPMGGAFVNTDEEGHYRFENINPGSYYISYVAESLDNAASLDERQAVITRNEEVEINLHLEGSSATLSGNATMDGGNWFDMAFLRAANSKGGRGKEYSARIGEAGSFSFADVPAGEYRISFQINAPDQQSDSATDNLVIPEGQTEVSYSRNFAGATFEGKITTDENTSIIGRDVKLSLYRWKEDPRTGELKEPTEGFSFLSTNAGYDGFFRFHKFLAGKYDVVIEATGIAAKRVTLDLRGDIQMNFAISGESGSLLLVLKDFGGYSDYEKSQEVIIHFSLLNSEGKAVFEHWNARFQKSKDYALVVDEVPAGLFDIRFHAYGHADTYARGVRIGGGEPIRVEVSVMKEAQAHITIDNEELSPSQIAEATLQLFDAEGNEIKPVPETNRNQPFNPPSRTFSLMPLADGSYTLKAKLKGYKELVVTFTVHAGKEATRLRATFVKKE